MLVSEYGGSCFTEKRARTAAGYSVTALPRAYACHIAEHSELLHAPLVQGTLLHAAMRGAGVRRSPMTAPERA